MKHKEKEKPKESAQPSASPGGGQKEPAAKSVEPEKTLPAIEDLQKEKDELFGKLQRVSADYINFQKRTAKQTADTIAYEKEKIIKTLLPALDNFEHTLQNAPSAENADVLLKGIRIVYDQILGILKSHGVEHIKALGEKFDPALHEAVSQKAESEKEDNIVLEEFQKGYKLNGRAIRPSRVIINKLPSQQETPEQDSAEQEQAGVEDETTDT